MKEAYEEWTSFIEKYFTCAEEKTVDELYPTMRDISTANSEILKNLPPTVKELTVNNDAIDRHTIQLISIGESFRSKRAKVSEFLYKKMGREAPPEAEGFFQSVVGMQGSRRLAERSPSVSARSVVSGHSSGGSRQSAPAGSALRKRKRTGEESPRITFSDASQPLSQTSSLAPAAAAPVLGPNVYGRGRTERLGEYRVRAFALYDTLRKTEPGSQPPRFDAVLRQTASLMRYFISDKQATFSDPLYGFDTVRSEFTQAASPEHVKRCLARILRICDKQAPARPMSLPLVRPIILVPGYINSCISICNAKTLLSSGKWVDPMQARVKADLNPGGDIMKINRPSCPFREFIIRDSVDQMKPDDWNYVCAVFVSGQKWQFDGFFGKKGTAQIEARDVLSKIAGFHLQYDDEMLPDNITKWNVMLLRVSRHMNRRHNDIKTVEDFWRALLKKMPFMNKFRRYFRDG
ncbi:Protein CDC73-like protein [Diplonema papillatum]|nr:Protein CDC73-like protein [Diplonema papillatum]